MHRVGDTVEVLKVGSAHDGDVGTVLATPLGYSPLFLYLRFADGTEAAFMPYEVRPSQQKLEL